jgi:U3 small nucleolar RNA-associated protein 18
MIDAPIAATGNDEEEEDELDSEIDYEQDEEASSSDSPAVSPSAQPSWLSTPSSSKPTKASLWHDPSDNQIDITMSDDKRLRKLVRGKEGPETRVDGKGLENKLREQFNKMHPEPEWANKVARKEARKRSEKGNTDPLAALFQSTASFIAPRVNRGPLPKGSLEIRRLRDANYQARTVWEGGNGKKKVDEGQGKARFADTGMTDIKFHPKVEVLAAVGADRRLRLFNVSSHCSSC